MKYNPETTIKDLRKAKKLNQNDLSRIIGISERNYREKENGKVPFNQYEIIKLIIFFEMDAEDAYNIFYINAGNSLFYKIYDSNKFLIKSQNKVHNKL